MNKPTGGAAFPVPEMGTNERYQGMTLRDYFAAKALPSIVSSCDWEDEECTVQSMAEDAYSLADAMLAERIKS